MYISLYRRYRPQTFSDMVGQSAAVGVLLESLKEGSLGHAYLFSGPRGCGKTSAARLVAKSLDCLNRSADCEPCGECENCRAIAAGEHLDVIEIDGASNNGIDQIRDLKSHVSLKPLASKYKVYIIDEVHMLTTQAFNGLLKTLEEPPSNVVFLLATTEPQKIPVTIRSRCQHIPFHRITIADTVERIKYVCGRENTECDEEAVWEVARQADGALRDALSITEQAIALGHGRLSLESVRELTGGSSRTELESWITALRTEPQKAAAAIHSILARGISPQRLCEALFVLFRDLWYYSLWKEKAFEALESSSAEKKYIEKESAEWPPEKLEEACSLCAALLPRTRYGMKGDIFSGLIFMELREILEGHRRKAAPQLFLNKATEKTGAVKRPAPEELQPPHSERPQQQSQPHSQQQSQQQPGTQPQREAPAPAEPRYTEPLSAGKLLASTPLFDLDPVSELPQLPEPEAKELFEKLGDSPFAKLVCSVPEGRLPLAAALLCAQLSEKEGKLEISFDRPQPSKNYLSVPHVRKALEQAASELWGTEAPEAKKTEAAPAAQQQPPAPATSPAEQNEQEPAAGAQPQQKKQETEPADKTKSPVAKAMMLAGAELLYIKTDDSQESEEGTAE